MLAVDVERIRPKGGRFECAACLLVAVLASGCLVSDPPEFERPKRRPPVPNLELMRYKANTLNHITRSPVPIEINVPIRSEDEGLDVVGELWQDTDQPVPEFIRNAEIDASSFDNAEQRSLNFPWTISDASLGCTVVTLFATHRGNLNRETKETGWLPSFKDPNDGVTVSWWFWIDAEGSVEPNEPVRSCDPPLSQGSR